MAKQMPKTPLLDQLESGPWPSFVSGLKRLAQPKMCAGTRRFKLDGMLIHANRLVRAPKPPECRASHLVSGRKLVIHGDSGSRFLFRELHVSLVEGNFRCSHAHLGTVWVNGKRFGNQPIRFLRVAALGIHARKEHTRFNDLGIRGHGRHVQLEGFLFFLCVSHLFIDCPERHENTRVFDTPISCKVQVHGGIHDIALHQETSSFPDHRIDIILRNCFQDSLMFFKRLAVFATLEVHGCDRVCVRGFVRS